MHNQYKIIGCVALLYSAVTLLSACASGGRGADGRLGWLEALPEASEASQPVTLVLRSQDGHVEKADYLSRAEIEEFVEEQRTSRREEKVTFQIETKGLGSQGSTLKWQVQARGKLGSVDLHDLAFPEPGEVLNLEMSAKGKVFKAGSFPKESVFYVPPISLPEKPVQVGDTWSMGASWVSQKNKLPLHIDLHSHFVRLRQCPGKHLCAELDLTGEVQISGLDPTVVAFESRIQGKILFDVNAGTILWSKLESEETLADRANSIRVRSCLTSALREPKGEAVYSERLVCEPRELPRQPSRTRSARKAPA